MTIYEIAELAGVSIATVSRVVNDSPMVSEKTKARVRRIMEENDYTPNMFARGLGLNSMRTIGLICPDVSDAYMAKAVACLESNLREYGYDCMLYCSGSAYHGRQMAVSTILQKRPDALVLIGSLYAGGAQEDGATDYIREAANKVPVFLFNGYIEHENIYCALCNDFEASYFAVRELLRAGRRRILYLSDSLTPSAEEKRCGYVQAHADAGVAADPALSVHAVNNIAAARDALRRRPDLSFDAVFASDDGLAVGALKYAKARGLRVPEDVSIIGYNNSELSISCDPELTTVDSRVERLCRIIIDSMMLLLQKKPISHKVYTKGRLVRRATTAL